MSKEAPHPNWSIRCISVPGEDTDLALYVSFEKTRFLFGCGQGTQRAFVQKRLSMRGLSAIFLHSGTEDGRGGLAGCIMTAADAGIKQLSVVGPSDTSHFIATLRSAVQRDLIAIDPVSFPLGATGNEARKLYESPNMTVHSIALRPQPEASSSRSPPRSPPQSSEFAGILPFDPLARDFGPSKLDQHHLRQWTDLVVGDMFGKRMRAPINPDSSTRSHPLVTGDGMIRFNRTHTQYALPQVSDGEVETEMVYICQAPDVRGKFDVAKANALGLRNGPDRGKLTRGENVEVDDPSVPGGKRVIRPEDCLVGGGPGAVLIIVNCSELNLDALLSADYLKQFHAAPAEGSKKVHAVVHRVTTAVWEDERYQAWVRAFGPETHHLYTDTRQKAQEAFFRSAAWNATQLSFLDPTIFPVPYAAATSHTSVLPSNCQILSPNLEVRMHPPAAPALLPVHSKDRPFPTTASELEWAKDVLSKESTEYALACDEARKAVASDPRSNQTTAAVGDDITVTTLGTGSAIPSKYRNVSATHLDIPGIGGVLLDCGEGSLGQLRRRFGPEGSRRVLEELRLIYVSHMHADHHLGLQSILREKVKVGTEGPFFVVGPQSIGLALAETRAWQHGIDLSILDKVIFLDNARFGQKPREAVATSPPGSPNARRTTLPLNGWPSTDIFARGQEGFDRHQAGCKLLTETLGLTKFAAPIVEHRGRAYGLVLEHTSGWKIVYSGDTKPCQALVKAGKDATLLIHEATLEDDKPEVAAQKGHSTFSQAIDIGKQMNASHILLNHFSQRYPKLPKLNLPANPSSSEAVISISFDFMSIKLGDMWKMAHYMDALSLLFDEADPEDGDDTMEAVEHDHNPSVDNPAPATGGGKGKGKQKQQTSTSGNGNGNGNAAPMAVDSPAPVLLSNRARKRAERKAELEAREEAENNAARERSPAADLPDAKRSKRDIVMEEIANTA